MTKHPLLCLTLLSLLVALLVLISLHFSPGKQGGQLEGVAITQVSVVGTDGGDITLPDDLSRSLVALLRKYDRLDYTSLLCYTPRPGDLLLSGQNRGTCFYLTVDTPPVLVRVNQDNYSATTKRSTAGTALREDPAYLQWRQALDAYLNP